MNDPHFAMSIYEEAGDVYFKGHRNRMASLPFYRVRGRKIKYIWCIFVGLKATVPWSSICHDTLNCSKLYFDSIKWHHGSHSTETIHIWFQDGSLPFARSIKDVHSEFRLLSKLTELLMNQGEQEEALQYGTLAVQIAGKTGTESCMAYRRIRAVWLLVNF